MRSINQEIKKYRIMRGETQASLSKKLGIPTTAFSAYETGIKMPKIELRCNIAEVLDVDPIALSGIDLDEKKELRLLGKLLYKYSISMEYDENKDCVNVVLPGILKTISKTFEENEKDIENDEYSFYESQMKDFFIETWPTYDVFYQAYLQGIDPDAGGKRSLRTRIDKQYILDFEQYKTNYLDKTENQIIETDLSRQDLFLDSKDDQYETLKNKAEKLKDLKKKSDLGFESLTSLLWNKGYSSMISIADIISIFYGLKVPSQLLLNDIESILREHKTSIDN